MERFSLYWITADVVIEEGATLKVGSGAHIYGGVDWVSMAMSADETQDLTQPEVGPSFWKCVRSRAGKCSEHACIWRHGQLPMARPATGHESQECQKLAHRNSIMKALPHWLSTSTALLPYTAVVDSMEPLGNRPASAWKM